MTHEHDNTGRHNCNPGGMGIVELLLEDFRTHDRNLFEPGLWAIAAHRLGNWRMGVRPKLVRAPLTALYYVVHNTLRSTVGVDLGYTVNLGRRVRIWHNGGIVIGARRIGDDVHIRQNTTIGILTRDALEAKPVIGNRVDIGAGACILGNVRVGDDAIIGANSVVTRDVAPTSVVWGVPARPVTIAKNATQPARAAAR